MSSKQYREFAQECLLWAEESSSEADRQHFIAMAKAWVHAAAELADVSHDQPARPNPVRRKGNRSRTARGRI